MGILKEILLHRMAIRNSARLCSRAASAARKWQHDPRDNRCLGRVTSRIAACEQLQHRTASILNVFSSAH
jgi:hypothetical protein